MLVGGQQILPLLVLSEEDGELVLKRIAVGNHILVGGDNMDLTLAHFARNVFADKGIQLDAWQSVSLWHSCGLQKNNYFLKMHLIPLRLLFLEEVQN